MCNNAVKCSVLIFNLLPRFLYIDYLIEQYIYTPMLIMIM